MNTPRSISAGSIPTASPTWLEGGRIPCLDGLRALAILLVLYAHGHFPGDHLLPLRTLKGRCGFLGVQIFFVLSGFLITTLMLREVRRTGRLHLGRFYLRRALRIVPAYAAYLVLLAILDASGAAHLDSHQWLAAGTYTVNFLPALPHPMSHLWSLCVEEHFYLLWPLMIAVLPLDWCRRAVPACMAAAFLLRWGLLLISPNAPIDLLTFTRIDDIAVGCGIAFLAHEPVWRCWMDRFVASRRQLVLLLLVFALAQVCFSRMFGARLFPLVVLPLAVALANSVNALTIAALMWAVLARPSSMLGRLLNHRAAVGLGVISYSVYLWHQPLCGVGGPAWLCSFPQNLVFILLAATLSYRWIESPFLAWKDRLASARRTGASIPLGDGPPRLGAPRPSAAFRGVTARRCLQTPPYQPEEMPTANDPR